MVRHRSAAEPSGNLRDSEVTAFATSLTVSFADVLHRRLEQGDHEGLQILQDIVAGARAKAPSNAIAAAFADAAGGTVTREATRITADGADEPRRETAPPNPKAAAALARYLAS